jgi:serine/threonine-protein kinase
MSDELSGSISIHLIDPADGRSLQTWSFGQPQITIGRAENGDIPLTDPYVSRLHAELTRSEGTWSLVSRGRNGVFIDGKNVERHPLRPGTMFRLGANGPMFRFEHQAAASPQATLSFDPAMVIMLKLDQQAVQTQAQDIMTTDYFQQLQQRARALRQQRS